MNIYVHKDGTQYGPYTLEQLQQYIQQGSFTLQDQACYDGQNWVTIARCLESIIRCQSITSSNSTPGSNRHSPAGNGQKETVSAQTKQAAQTSDQSSQQVSQDSGKGGTKILLLVGGLVILLIGLSAGLWISFRR